MFNKNSISRIAYDLIGQNIINSKNDKEKNKNKWLSYEGKYIRENKENWYADIYIMSDRDFINVIDLPVENPINEKTVLESVGIDTFKVRDNSYFCPGELMVFYRDSTDVINKLKFVEQIYFPN